MVPGLEARLMESSEEEINFVADLVSAGKSRCGYLPYVTLGAEGRV
jgi:hypothetical protein